MSSASSLYGSFKGVLVDSACSKWATSLGFVEHKVKHHVAACDKEEAAAKRKQAQRIFVNLTGKPAFKILSVMP